MALAGWKFYGTGILDKGIADLNRELKTAGIQKIITEKQKQLDEYMAKKK